MRPVILSVASAHVKQMLVVFNVTDVYQDTTTCPQVIVMDVCRATADLGHQSVKIFVMHFMASVPVGLDLLAEIVASY